jgi:protein-S-isoprenylcysteine O-methyltransferase Ste14
MHIEPIYFKLAQAAAIVLYVSVGSDFARRQGTKLLIHPILARLMQWTYLSLVGLYGYTLYILDTVLIADLVALLLTLAGGLIFLKAKRDLAHRFTYVGYAFEKITVMRDGIYAHIRHPIYTGSYLFTIGALCTCVPRLPLIPIPLAAVSLFGVAYIYFFFIPLLASRESRHMREQIGEEFINYERSVHAFIPFLRRSN